MGGITGGTGNGIPLGGGEPSGSLGGGTAGGGAAPSGGSAATEGGPAAGTGTGSSEPTGGASSGGEPSSGGSDPLPTTTGGTTGIGGGGQGFASGGGVSSTGGLGAPTGTGTASTSGGSGMTGGNGGSTGGVSTVASGGPSSDGGASGGQAATGGTEPTGGTATGAAGGAGTGGGPGQGLSLYYVRHAETLANVLEDPSQMTLEDADTFTELGVRQVEAVTEYLLGSDLEFSAVIVSPALRAQKTIEPYLVATGLTGEIWLELTECCDDEPTGAPLPTEPTFYQFWEATAEGENLVFRDEARENWQIDTYEQGLFMVMTARDLLLERFGNTGQTVLISGHAVAGSILMGLLAGEDMSQGEDDFIMENRLFMMNTGIQHLEQDPETGLFEVVDTNINDPLSE